jgi:hypothetical protein
MHFIETSYPVGRSPYGNVLSLQILGMPSAKQRANKRLWHVAIPVEYASILRIHQVPALLAAGNSLADAHTVARGGVTDCMERNGLLLVT